MAVVCGSPVTTRMPTPARRQAPRMQAAANFGTPSALIPRQDAGAGAFCSWPRACDWPAAQEAAAAPQAPLQRLQASVQDLFRAEDPSLPPEVEQCALFSDGLAPPAEAQAAMPWYLSFWRYQGL